ncbi:MAG: DUF6147 family protein [Blautia sp.]|nr:DUF6147 family protein [Blautia sp.]
MRIIVRNIMILVLIFAMNVTVFAGTDDLNKVVDGSLLTNEKCSEISLNTEIRGNILNQGTAKITDNGNGSVNVYGAVYGSVTCDKLILKMTLQRYSNGSWYNIRTFSDTAYNTALLTKSYNVQVTRGYHYRVKAACVAQDGSISESKTPITNGIFVD